MTISARPVWTAAGFAALGVAAVGAVLPLLPTTPFVITYLLDQVQTEAT